MSTEQLLVDSGGGDEQHVPFIADATIVRVTPESVVSGWSRGPECADGGYY